MHVVDDIHGLVVDTGYFSQYLLVVGHNFLKLQCLTGQYGNTSVSYTHLDEFKRDMEK